MMKEIWKDIAGYEGMYKVSNKGRIKSFKGNEESIHSGILVKRTGYRVFNLYKNSKYNRKFIHRLVAEAFIPNPHKKPEIDHINTIRDDNRVENLRWVTRKENMNNSLSVNKLRISHTGYKNFNFGKKRLDGTRMKISKALKGNPLIKGKVGILCKNSKPVFQYDLNGNFIREYAGRTEAERATGIFQSSISRACKGNLKTAGGYIWRDSYFEKVIY